MKNLSLMTLGLYYRVRILMKLKSHTVRIRYTHTWCFFKCAVAPCRTTCTTGVGSFKIQHIIITNLIAWGQALQWHN